MRRTSTSLAMAAALLAAAGAMPSVSAQAQVEATAPTSPLQKAQRAVQQAPVRSAERFSGWGSFGSRGSQRRRGPGWTQAHVGRLAKKKRNQARNRRAHR